MGRLHFPHFGPSTTLVASMRFHVSQNWQRTVSFLTAGLVSLSISATRDIRFPLRHATNRLRQSSCEFLLLRRARQFFHCKKNGYSDANDEHTTAKFAAGGRSRSRLQC